MKSIIGKKLGMSQYFKEDGTVIPVTVVEVQPNVVVQVKTFDKDGYEAMQIGYGTRNKQTKAIKNHTKGLGSFANFKEFEGLKNGEKEAVVGDKFDVSLFEAGEVVRVTGISNGKGFAGAVKRHGFHGMPASHGHKAVMRHVGSIGQRFPQHTLKGLRMAGRMGAVKTTTRGLKIVNVDLEKNTIAIKGAIPGNNGGTVIINSAK
jgi:large subunit ribosomal protein L3